MIIETHYSHRREDVDAHFRCLEFIDSVESYKQ